MTQASSGRYSILAGILVVVYILIGARGLYSRVRAEPSPSPGPFATSDTYLANQVGLHRPSQAVIEAVDRVPPGVALLFVGPADDPFFIQTYYVIVYLAWPRPVSAVECDGQGRARFSMGPPVEPAGPAAAILYGLAPTDGASVQVVAPRLSVASGLTSRGWADLCP